jgi:hypothetical protein
MAAISPRSAVPCLSRGQAADWWTNPRSARRTASSKSRSIKRPPRNCSQATIRSRKMPRFSAGKPSAAFQMVRSCESDSANMRPWSGEGGGCQPLSCEARANILNRLRRREAAISHCNDWKARELTLRRNNRIGGGADVADCGSVVDFWLGDVATQATSSARALPGESSPPRESQSSMT